MIRRPRSAIVRAKAKELHEKLRIVEPNEIEVEMIAFYHGIQVVEEDLAGMDGCIVRKGDSAIISVRRTIDYPPQKRFVVAHELGHYFVHPHSCQIKVDSKDNLADWSETNIEEYEANLFAAELLMPTQQFKPRTTGQEPSLELASKLAEEFRTGFMATAYQMVSTSQEECALICSSQRQRLWAVRSPGFSFQLLEDGRIHGCSIAAQVDKRGGQERSSDIDASFWLHGYYGDTKSKLTEDSKNLGNIGRTLTLLWIHDDI